MTKEEIFKHLKNSVPVSCKIINSFKLTAEDSNFIADECILINLKKDNRVVECYTIFNKNKKTQWKH